MEPTTPRKVERESLKAPEALDAAEVARLVEFFKILAEWEAAENKNVFCQDKP